MRKKLLIVCLLAVSSLGWSQETIKTMFYNLLQFPTANPGNRAEILGDILDAYDPDILMVCELESLFGANQVLDVALNDDGIRYSRAQFIINQSSGSPLQQLIYYRSDKFFLQDIEVITTSIRDINRYVLRLNTVDAATDPVFLDIYVSHLKSSQGSDNENLRLQMVQAFGATLGDLDPNSYVIFAGDLNVYDSDEPAYQELLDPTNPITLVDPINRPGNWHTNSNFADVHTQSTRESSAPFGAGAGGDMDDRFDFILISENMMTDPTMRYVEDSYLAYGNNGNCYNGSINDSDCAGFFGTNLRNDLYNMSDHLPVVMALETDKEFQILSGTEFDASSELIRLENTLANETIAMNVSTQLTEEVTINLVNTLGQRLWNSTLVPGQRHLVDVSQLAPGMYFITSSVSQQTLKFIKTSW